MEKENIVSCGDKNPSAREIELEGEILSLKHQIGGLKTANGKYHSQVEDLKKKLNDAATKEQELRHEISHYVEQIIDYKDTIKELDGEIDYLRGSLKSKEKPWWKRIF